MSDAKLSRDLALALGWDRVEIAASGEECLVKQVTDHGWRWFDYRHHDVCLPLIKWLMMEHGAELWRGVWFAIRGFECLSADAPTLEEAVARAVIAVKGKP